MRAGDFKRARAELKSFHDEFSDNSFPLEIALAESFERERDFASAAEAYRRITARVPRRSPGVLVAWILGGLAG